MKKTETLILIFITFYSVSGIYCLFSFRLENNKPQISFRYMVVKVSLKGVYIPGADLEGACGACAPPKIRKAYVIQR